MKRCATVLLLLGLIATAPVGAAPKPAAGKTFTFRIPGEPETLDWNKAHTPIETYLLLNLMEGLITFDTKFKLAPALAQSWKVSEDGRTYTFKLRPGVKWSDGVPLRAQDFVYSWKRLLSPVTAASYAYFLFDVEGAEWYNKGSLKDFSAVGIKALDDLTFQVKLARPVAHWIYVPTFWVTFPLREDIVEKYGTSSWATPGRMVTLGPYTLASHDHDSKITMKANPTYYGQRGNIDQVIGLIVNDDSTAMNLYETGKIDFLTDISTLDLKRLAGRPDLKTFPYLKTGYIGFEVNKYPMSSVHVRKAIAMAIDKSKVGQFLHGGQRPATSFVPPQMMAFDPKGGLPFDPAQAKALLRQAGIDPGRFPQVEMLVANWDKSVTLAQFLQGQLKKNLGITVMIQPFDHKTFRAQLDTHTYPVFEASWSADFPDPDNFLSVFLSSAGNNRTGWKSEKFDELVVTSRNLPTKSRERNYKAAEKILLEEEAVIVPLYYEPNMAMVRSRVKGLELNPINYLLLRKVNLVD